MRRLSYNQAIQVAASQQLVAGRVACIICLVATASAPHHWLFKQNENVRDEVQNDPRNLVLLCHLDHAKFGQTPVAFNAAFLFKQYVLKQNLRAWLTDLWIDQEIESPKAALPSLEDIPGAADQIARMKAYFGELP